MKNNVKKFSLIFGLIIALSAVVVGIIFLTPQAQTPTLRVQVFSAQTGTELTAGMTNGDIEFFNQQGHKIAASKTNNHTYSLTLNPNETITLKPVAETGYEFTGFYDNELMDYSAFLTSNNYVFTSRAN